MRQFLPALLLLLGAVSAISVVPTKEATSITSDPTTEQASIDDSLAFTVSNDDSTATDISLFGRDEDPTLEELFVTLNNEAADTNITSSDVAPDSPTDAPHLVSRAHNRRGIWCLTGSPHVNKHLVPGAAPQISQDVLTRYLKHKNMRLTQNRPTSAGRGMRCNPLYQPRWARGSFCGPYGGQIAMQEFGHALHEIVAACADGHGKAAGWKYYGVPGKTRLYAVKLDVHSLPLDTLCYGPGDCS